MRCLVWFRVGLVVAGGLWGQVSGIAAAQQAAGVAAEVPAEIAGKSLTAQEQAARLAKWR